MPPPPPPPLTHRRFVFWTQSQDFLLHMPMGPSSSASEPIGGAPTLPSPDLGAPIPSDPPCGCEACVERR